MKFIIHYVLVCILHFNPICFARSFSKCSTELQKVVVKPVVCGEKYFEKLYAKFVLNFDPQIAAEPLRISQYCQSFSSENDVIVNILDAQGIDMCSFRNQFVALYAQFFTLLNHR